MARPNKTGLDYFPFDVDFFDDEKIVAIAGEYGIKGEITVIKLLCAIYRNGYFIEWSEMMQMKMLKHLPGISADLLNTIVSRLVKWGFFDKTLFDSANVLSSVGIQRRFFHSTKRRNSNGDLPFMLVYVCNNRVSAHINPVDKEFLSTLTPQSKVKNIKKKISTDVDTKEISTTATSIHDEIEKLKSEDSWLDQLQVIHHIDKSSLCKKLDEFRAQCLADGKEQHQSLQDAKKHFNSWLRILKNKNDDSNKSNSRNQRRGNSLSADEPKTYGESF